MLEKPNESKNIRSLSDEEMRKARKSSPTIPHGRLRTTSESLMAESMARRSGSCSGLSCSRPSAPLPAPSPSCN